MYEWPVVEWAELRKKRWQVVVEIMRRMRLDHLLLSGHDNIRYVTDYRSMLIAEGFDWYAAVVDDAGESTLFVPYVAKDVAFPQPDLPLIRKFVATPSWSPNTCQEAVWIPLLTREIRRAKAKRVGVEYLSFQFVDALRRELPDVEFISVAAALYGAREIKFPEEIRLLEAASAVNSLASSAALHKVEEGMTDFELLAIAMHELQRMGVEYMTHSLCITRDVQLSGNWFAKGKRLWEGDAFFFDIGCYGAGGYASDMCRTGFVGEPSLPIRRAYRGLLNAYEAGQNAARPGIRASEINWLINNALEKHGLNGTPYSVGHGVGLRACELPIIYRPDMMESDAVLREGMVIALEPETSIEVDGIPVVLKVEDNFEVQQQGVRRLTRSRYAPPGGWSGEKDA